MRESLNAVLPPGWLDANTRILVNPSGSFIYGGPAADTGLTGRKIIVDTYGGAAPHGGGAFSGKDPTKVDGSAAYAARHLAKSVVAAGLAERCLIQLAYAIGVAEPLALNFDSEGSPAIIVRDGRLCIFCGDDPEAAVPATFDGWFKSLLGRQFPLSGWGNKLRAVGQHQWVTPGVAERDIQGFPHPMSVAGRTTYRLAAFGGHGMNSYAIYLTDVRPGLSLRLRLSFGGVYGDAERDSAAVVTTVQRLYALVDTIGDRLAHFEFESDMGRHRARLRGTAEEWEGCVDDLEDLEIVALQVAEGRMPALRNRERRPP